MNHVIYIAAVVQIRNDTPGREYYRRKLAAGKTPLEALRCLKRRISDAIFRQLLADARRDAEPAAAEDHIELGETDRPAAGAGPGGHCGATQESSATDLTPHVGTSDKPLHGPAEPTLQPANAATEELTDQALQRVP